jgi:hypothetical protein
MVPIDFWRNSQKNSTEPLEVGTRAVTERYWLYFIFFNKILVYKNKFLASFNNHVTCFVEKAWSEPMTLGIKAERYVHCATRQVDTCLQDSRQSARSRQTLSLEIDSSIWHNVILLLLLTFTSNKHPPAVPSTELLPLAVSQAELHDYHYCLLLLYYCPITASLLQFKIHYCYTIQVIARSFK